MNCAKNGCNRPVKKDTNYCADHQPEEGWVLRRRDDFDFGNRDFTYDGTVGQPRESEKKDKKEKPKDRR